MSAARLGAGTGRGGSGLVLLPNPVGAGGEVATDEVAAVETARAAAVSGGAAAVETPGSML